MVGQNFARYLAALIESGHYGTESQIANRCMMDAGELSRWKSKNGPWPILDTFIRYRTELVNCFGDAAYSDLYARLFQDIHGSSIQRPTLPLVLRRLDSNDAQLIERCAELWQKRIDLDVSFMSTSDRLGQVLKHANHRIFAVIENDESVAGASYASHFADLRSSVEAVEVSVFVIWLYAIERKATHPGPTHRLLLDALRSMFKEYNADVLFLELAAMRGRGHGMSGRRRLRAAAWVFVNWSKDRSNRDLIQPLQLLDARYLCPRLSIDGRWRWRSRKGPIGEDVPLLWTAGRTSPRLPDVLRMQPSQVRRLLYLCYRNEYERGLSPFGQDFPEYIDALDRACGAASSPWKSVFGEQA